MSESAWEERRAAALAGAARAMGCDTAETVLWACEEILNKSAGTKERILAQIRAGADCDVCPPGFLAVTSELQEVTRAVQAMVQALTDADGDEDRANGGVAREGEVV